MCFRYSFLFFTNAMERMNNQIKLPPIDNILPSAPPVALGPPPVSMVRTLRSASTPLATISHPSASSAHTKKRQRKRFEDVERLYYCDFKNCNKGYGSLTHLNEHRVIQKHGARKKIEDFKHIKLIQKQNKREKKNLITLPPIRQPLPNYNNNNAPILINETKPVNPVSTFPIIPSPSLNSTPPAFNAVSLSNYHYPMSNEDQQFHYNTPRIYDPQSGQQRSAEMIVPSLLKMKNEK